MNSKIAILSGVSWTVILNVVNGIYGFISVPLLIAYYGKANYGLITIALSINVYLRLLDLGFNSTNVKFYSSWMSKGWRLKVKRLFQTSLGFYGFIGLINGLVLLIIAYFSDDIFHVSEEEAVVLRHLIYILSGSSIINWFCSCFNQVIMASEQVGWVQRMLVVPKLFQLLVIGMVYMFDFTIETYFLLTCLSMLVIVPFSVKKIKTIIHGVSFFPSIRISILKEILPYCINIFSFGIFQMSMENLKPIFLGMRTTSSIVAEYKIISSIVTLTIMIGGSFMSTLLPSVSKAKAQNDRTVIEKIAYQGTKYITISLAFCAFGLMTVSDELMILYVGEQYLHLVPYLKMWLLLTLFSHNQGISAIILAGSDIRALTYSSAIATILGLTTCWFFIPYYSIGGVIIGQFVYCIIQFLFYYCYYWPRKLLLNSKRIFFMSFSRPVVTTIISYILSVWMFSFVNCYIESIIYRIFFKGILFLTISVSLHYVLTLEENDKLFFKRLIKK